MKFDAFLTGGLGEVPERIRELEAMGCGGAMTAETSHDPFFPLLLAAEHSTRIELMTSIAVAFARSPMILANLAHDLNSYSRGRFILGLGSQIQPHITKRFSMPWSHPAPRMRELVLAMRAIWASWYEGKKLEFRGEFYTHTLMTPMFTPLDTKYGVPKVFLGAVGPHMAEVAGATADGMIGHPFITERYMREVTIPAIERGLAKSGRRRSEFQLSLPVFIVTGASEEERVEQRTAVCKQIAFYGSTPAYRPVLDLHGWGDLQSELNPLSKQGQWDRMGELIDDEVLGALAIVGSPDEVVPKLLARYGTLVDRVSFTMDHGAKFGSKELVAALHG